MAKTQERIKTDYKAMEASRGMVQQCSVCGIRYRSHEVRPLCSDCEDLAVELEEINTFFYCAAHPSTTVSARATGYYCSECQCTPERVISGVDYLNTRKPEMYGLVEI